MTRSGPRFARSVSRSVTMRDDENLPIEDEQPVPHKTSKGDGDTDARNDYRVRSSRVIPPSPSASSSPRRRPASRPERRNQARRRPARGVRARGSHARYDFPVGGRDRLLLDRELDGLDVAGRVDGECPDVGMVTSSSPSDPRRPSVLTHSVRSDTYRPPMRSRGTTTRNRSRRSA